MKKYLDYLLSAIFVLLSLLPVIIFLTAAWVLWGLFHLFSVVGTYLLGEAPSIIKWIDSED